LRSKTRATRDALNTSRHESTGSDAIKVRASRDLQQNANNMSKAPIKETILVVDEVDRMLTIIVDILKTARSMYFKPMMEQAQ